MTIRDKVSIVGAFEHPTRLASDISTARIHAEVARGALDDAGLRLQDVDGYFCASDAPGGTLAMAEYLGLNLRYHDSTEGGGSSYLSHVGHAAAAIASGRCNVALITMGGRPRSESDGRATHLSAPALQFEQHFKPTVLSMYSMAAARHMHEYGTTSEQLAWVKVAASRHASHNANALLRKEVSVEDVLASPRIAGPLHRLDCCVITDGGGALVLTRPEIARSLGRSPVSIRGHGETLRYHRPAGYELLETGVRAAGKAAFDEAGITIADVRYASIYDSFTITVVLQLEDLGFCEKGQGGRFVENGALIANSGVLAVNTDGGGLCNNHPGFRGGMVKMIEAVRQVRGEAHPDLQVPNCDIAVVTGIGGMLGSRHAASVIVLERG